MCKYRTLNLAILADSTSLMVNIPSMHYSARSVYMATESGQAEAAAALCSRLIRPTNEGDRMSHVA